jgi:hypothetical protein
LEGVGGLGHKEELELRKTIKTRIPATSLPLKPRHYFYFFALMFGIMGAGIVVMDQLGIFPFLLVTALGFGLLFGYWRSCPYCKKWYSRQERNRKYDEVGGTTYLFRCKACLEEWKETHFNRYD